MYLEHNFIWRNNFTEILPFYWHHNGLYVSESRKLMGTQVLDLLALEVARLETASSSHKSSSTLLKLKESKTTAAKMVYDLWLPGKLVDHLVHFPHSQLWFKASSYCTSPEVLALPVIDWPSCLMFVTKLKAYTELLCLYDAQMHYTAAYKHTVVTIDKQINW